MKQDKIYPCAALANDLHVSKDNISDFQKNWDELLRICQDRGINQILIGGDFFQSRVGQPLHVLVAVFQAFEKAETLGIEVTIGEGNHDKVDPEAIIGYAHIFSKHPNVFVVDDYSAVDFGSVVIYLMSYFPEGGSFSEKLQLVIDDLSNDAINILYCHEGINGGIAQPSDKELPTKIFEPFNKVLVGHYHNRKKITGTNIEYIGSSRQHNYGEDAMKGYTILYSDGSTEFIQNQVNTRFYTLEATSIEEAKAMLEDKVRSDAGARIKMRITCASDTASTIDKEALIELGATKVEVVTEASDSFAKVADFDAKYDKAGLKEEYSRFCKQKEINNIQLGLDYLDKIN